MTEREIRPYFAEYLRIEATPDAPGNDKEGRKKFEAAYYELEKMWPNLTADEQYYIQSGHKWPVNA